MSAGCFSSPPTMPHRGRAHEIVGPSCGNGLLDADGGWPYRRHRDPRGSQDWDTRLDCLADVRPCADAFRGDVNRRLALADAVSATNGVSAEERFQNRNGFHTCAVA